MYPQNRTSTIVIAHGYPSYWWDGILTNYHNNDLPYWRELTCICMSFSGTTIACLWLGIHQTSPDYGVWNCLGESASDISTVLILQFRHTSGCWVWWSMGLLSVIPELYEELEQAFQASWRTRFGQARSFPLIVHRTLRLGITTFPNPPKFCQPPCHHLLQLPLFGRQSRTAHAHRTFEP